MLRKYIYNWIKFKTLESTEFIVLLCILPVILILNFAIQILILKEQKTIISTIGVTNLFLINSTIFIVLMLISFIKVKPKINTVYKINNMELKYFINYIIIFFIFFILFDFGSTLLVITNMDKFKYIICMLFIIILPIIYLYLNIQIKNITLSRILFLSTILINNLLVYYFIWPLIILSILLGIWLIVHSREWLFKTQVKTMRSFERINLINHYFIYLIRDYYFIIFLVTTTVITMIIKYGNILLPSQRLTIYQFSDILFLFFLCINWNALKLRTFESDVNWRHNLLNLQILLFKITIIICFEFAINNSFQLLSITSINNFLIISLVYSAIGDKMVNIVKEFIIVVMLIILMKNFFINQLWISPILIIFLLIIQYYEVNKNNN